MRCLVLVCALLMVSAVRGQEALCSYIDSVNFPYVQDFECTDTGNRIRVWENCTVNEELFTVNQTGILQDDSSGYCGGYLVLASDQVTMLLGKKLDAESGERPPACSITVDSDVPTYIIALDINEFYPQPEGGSRVTEVDMEENKPDAVVTTLTYTDEDKGETETLTISPVPSEFQKQFSMTQEKNVFTLSTKDALDYETRSVYKLEFSIISTDEFDTEKSSNHTVLLFVLDEGDTPPYWVHTEPTAKILEGPADRFVYYVKAADRDFGINNDVKYSITGGNDEGFFAIDEISGNVTLVKEIDYEEDTRFFTLTVTAQEYFDDGTVAPDPSSSTTITNINIEDVNDEQPTFNQDSYEKTIDEVVDSPVPIDLDMFVYDGDSASTYSQYTITSDKEDYLTIEPSQGRDNTSIRLWALSTPDGIFDYEKTADQPIIIALTATELANSSHSQTVSLTITLNDKNDNTPKFETDPYDASVLESKGKGFEVVTVSAYDLDKSPRFGNESIRYSGSCTNVLDVDEKSGRVTLTRDGALNYESAKNVLCQITARDGDGVEQTSSECTVNITVVDVNDSPPALTFNVQNVTVKENSPKGTVVEVEIGASDLDTTASLSFDIDWESSTASKDGAPVNIEKVKKWFVVEELAKGENASAALKVGAGNPDREVADTLQLSIKVTDKNTEDGYSDTDSKRLLVQILDENDTPPEFVGDYSDLKVFENSENGTKVAVVNASDKDENDAVTFSIKDDTYITITQLSDFSAELIVSGKTEIDREERETVLVILTIEDKAGHPIEQTFNVTVLDENDNPPIFQDDIILTSFTPYDTPGNILITFKADDADQSENLNYMLENDFEWPDGGFITPPEVPFRVQKKEDNYAELLLNFDPVGVNTGYCNFTISCLDNDGLHKASILGKVYAITSDYEVAVSYNNPVSYVKSLVIPIQNIFKEVYEFPSIIDSAAEGEDSTKSIVKMHFIDKEKNEPVQASRIIEMSNDYSISQALISKNEDLGLDIESVGNVTPDKGGGINNVLILEIVLGIVSLVLGSLLLLLLITYFMRTRSLERKLKVATTTTFGSVASDLNRMDMGGGVPGSNKFAGEGANPMYNLSDSYLRNDDASSVGSGDSVLVGVEDNPDFKGYSAETNKATKGQSNPAFNRSIDDIAAPSPFSGGTRANPLMGLGMDGKGSGDLADALRNHDLFIRRRSVGSETDSGNSDDVDQNPNFSFM